MNKLKNSEVVLGIATLPLGVLFFVFVSVFIIRDAIWSFRKATL